MAMIQVRKRYFCARAALVGSLLMVGLAGQAESELALPPSDKALEKVAAFVADVCSRNKNVHAWMTVMGKDPVGDDKGIVIAQHDLLDEAGRLVFSCLTRALLARR